MSSRTDKRLILMSSLASVILLSFSGCSFFGPQHALVTIDPGKRYQTISGWEATAQAGQDASDEFAEYSEDLFDRAVDDLGITRLRLEVRSGIENRRDYFSEWRSGLITEEEFNSKRYEVVNDNSNPEVKEPAGFQFAELDSTIEKVILPVKKRLEKNGQSLYLNLNFVDFGEGASTFRFADKPEEYAEFISAVFVHMDGKYGFVPDSVEAILEPDNDTGWNGRGVGEAVAAAARRLRAEGHAPDFIVPATKDARNATAYIEEIASVPGALENVTEFSYHLYRGATDSARREILMTAEKYGKKTSMLEFIGADHRTIFRDLTIANVSAWQQYTLAFPGEPDNGAQYFIVSTRRGARPEVKPGNRTRLLAEYFRNIKPGARRVGAFSDNPAAEPSAFVNPDGGFVVVVNAVAYGTLSVSGLPRGRYAVNLVGNNGEKREHGPTGAESGKAFAIEVPFPGVISIVSEE